MDIQQALQAFSTLKLRTICFEKDTAYAMDEENVFVLQVKGIAQALPSGKSISFEKEAVYHNGKFFENGEIKFGRATAQLPHINYDGNRIELSSADFIAAIRSIAKEKAKERPATSFLVKEGGFYLNGMENLYKLPTLSIMQKEKAVLECNYRIEYLKLFSKLNLQGAYCIEFMKEMPLSITAGDFKFILAPTNSEVEDIDVSKAVSLAPVKQKQAIPVKNTASEITAIQQEAISQAINENNKRINCESKEIKQHYVRLRKSVELVAKGYLNAAYIQGKAGIGKSYSVMASLNELNADYVEFAGDMTEAYLYRFLHENNGKVICFRDLVRLLQGIKSLDMLKAITETHGKRIVCKKSYSKEQADLPDFLECTSRFIFEFNFINLNSGLREDLEALFSRGDYINLVFSEQQIKDIMRQICANDEQKAVTEYLLSKYHYVGHNSLNLRTQNKAFKIHQYSKEQGKEWKEEIDTFLDSEMTATRRMLYSLMGDSICTTKELKKKLIAGHIDGVCQLRTAHRRIHEWILLGELHIAGFKSDNEEELESFLAMHRNFEVSLNPVELAIERVR